MRGIAKSIPISQSTPTVLCIDENTKCLYGVTFTWPGTLLWAKSMKVPSAVRAPMMGVAALA